MPTKADIKQIEKFREDARFLLSLYTNTGMDRNLGFKGNFSGYVNGHKNPSAEKIRKFYQIYGKDLERFDRDKAVSSVESEEENAPSLEDCRAELKIIKDNLSFIKDLLISHQHQQQLAEIRSKIDKIEDRLSADDQP